MPATSIGRNAFDSENLANISVSAENGNYSSEDGVLYNKEKTALVRYPAAKSDASFTTPRSVATIDENAFRYNKILSYNKEIAVGSDNMAYHPDSGVKRSEVAAPVSRILCRDMRIELPKG